jgi:hypothetical protein
MAERLSSATGILPHVMPRLHLLRLSSATLTNITCFECQNVVRKLVDLTHAKMFSAVSRQAIRSASRQQCRAFSSTPSVGAAAEVKKLGVVGAGQMVRTFTRNIEYVTDNVRAWA